MNIDWDDVAEAADNTPRSLLAEVLGIADEIESLIILVHKADGTQREWWITTDVTRVTMLALAHYAAVKALAEAGPDD